MIVALFGGAVERASAGRLSLRLLIWVCGTHGTVSVRVAPLGAMLVL